MTLFGVFSLLIGTVVLAAASDPTVTVRNGTYSGVSIPSFGQELFLGMPYAQPPLPPDLRLRAPQSLNTTWNGTRTADQYSAHCIGYPVSGINDDNGYPLSEDCLTLNIVRPAGLKNDSNIPVLVWIHGGFFSMGGSADVRYNGSWIVQRSVEMNQPVIFASLNYRVNIFGFIYSSEVEAEGGGNYGLLDQQLAIRWIHENIAAFGGDPTKVTLMGESSGAQSVAMHMLAEYGKSKPLFRGAILESGTATSTMFPSASDVQPEYDAIVSFTNCTTAASSLDCLRALPIEEFVAVTNNSLFQWAPVIDGTFLTDRPSRLMKADKMLRVPLLIGANLDEGTNFGPKGIDTDAELVGALGKLLPYLTNTSVDTLLQLYPNDALVGCPFGTGDALLSTGKEDKRSFAIAGDVAMHSGRRLLAQYMAQTEDVFSYHFQQPPDYVDVEVGVTHFSEVAFVFSNPLPTQNPLSTRPGDAELAMYMTSAWVSFANNLSPNETGISNATQWPNYRREQKNIVFLRHGNFLENDTYRSQQITYINSIAEELHV